VRKLFKDDFGKHFELTDGQADIFLSIFLKRNCRVEIIASTQYGKSHTLAMAIICRSQAFREKFAIVAGRKDKARIIQEAIIQHLFDNVNIVAQLEYDPNEPLDRLRRERSKDKLVWRRGGGVQVFSAQTKSAKQVFDSLTGFGSQNIVEDESGLIPDQFQTMILRMLGGFKLNYLWKVGNPFLRNHFKRTWESNRYEKILIDYQQALKEGRYSQDFIEEMRNEPFFDVLYECKFPEEELFDPKGYIRLLTDEEIKSARGKAEHSGVLSLGFDVSEGGSKNVGILRSSKFAEIVHRSNISDLMVTVQVIIDIIKKYNLDVSNVNVDKTGIGAGVVARLRELGYYVNGVMWGSKARKPETYANLKAENYWDAREWVKQGGTLEDNDGFNTLSVVKFKTETGSERIKIKTKEELRKDGISSPDEADAFALSFNKRKVPKITIL